MLQSFIWQLVEGYMHNAARSRMALYDIRTYMKIDKQFEIQYPVGLIKPINLILGAKVKIL